MRSGQHIAALSKLNCASLLFVLLVLSAIPAPAVAQVFGSTAELSFLPDHAVPGKIVTVRGTGWGAPREGTHCRISGDPVQHSSCALVCENESNCDPLGEFTVADVPAGRYSIKVRVDASYLIPLVVSEWFIVDAETTTIAPTSALQTTSTLSSYTTYRSSSLISTLTTTVEPMTEASAMDHPSTEGQGAFVLQSPMVLMLVFVAVVAAVLALIFRWKRPR